MEEWQTSNQDIQSVEKLLLPHGAHFQEDARNVIPVSYTHLDVYKRQA